MTIEELWLFEDILSENKVFVNENGEIRHSDAYNTLVDYDNLKKIIEKIKNDYTIEQWKEIVNHLLDNDLCINNKIVGYFIKGFFDFSKNNT